jgi:hypothetical protein
VRALVLLQLPLRYIIGIFWCASSGIVQRPVHFGVQKLDISCLFWFPLRWASGDSVSNSQQYVCSGHTVCYVPLTFNMVYCFSASCRQDLNQGQPVCVSSIAVC